MENIKIENTWDSDNVTREECKCYWPHNRTSCNPTITSCTCPSNRNTDNILESISCGSRLFTNTLYAKKYPNLIITNTGNYKTVKGELQVSHLNIFDTIQNKIIFSSKNDLSEANHELRILNPHCGVVNDIFQYDSAMMMDHFMIIRFQKEIRNYYSNKTYVVFNFKTHIYKIFMFCNAFYMYNDRTLFVFVTYGLGTDNYKIITKSDIDNNIDNIMEINSDKENRIEIQCMCNSSILTFKLLKRIACNHRDSSTTKSIYYDIKKQKFVYTSKNQFVGWRGDKLIEYDSELKKCNLISFTAINIPKKFINCNRCLDKFEELSEEIIPEHKNICSLCIIKL
jgi:hypothetical protein